MGRKGWERRIKQTTKEGVSDENHYLCIPVLYRPSPFLRSIMIHVDPEQRHAFGRIRGVIKTISRGNFGMQSQKWATRIISLSLYSLLISSKGFQFFFSNTSPTEVIKKFFRPQQDLVDFSKYSYSITLGDYYYYYYFFQFKTPQNQPLDFLTLS